MKNVFVVLLLLWSAIASAQFSIMGNITDQNGNYLPGATILISDTGQGASSDADGFFMFSNVSTGTYQFEVSYIGYTSWKETIIVSGKTVLSIVLEQTSFSVGEVEVLSTWANEQTPITYINLDKASLEKANLGQDVPFLLQWTPSAVVTSDAGAGVGYTGIRIRGSDPTRINVTINGIPLNDAESQGVFWVNLPDFLSSTEQLQIQRGVGTSTNGAGAFGASINLNTNKVEQKPYFTLGGTYGSFNTWKNNLRFGSGLLNNKVTIDGRLSYIHSDGYIDRAEANLQSGYLSMAYLGNKQSLRLNVFSGHELTYQAWNGVPADLIADRETRTFNSAGTEKTGTPHDNEVDDYVQTHVQLLYTQQLSSSLDVDLALHYTKGKGFFEQYKAGQSLSNYGLSVIQLSNPDTLITESNLIRRRWLNNDFYGLTYALKYRQNALDLTIGGALNNYDGQHFGEVIEADYILSNEIGTRYYDNDAQKLDANIFAKANYQLTPSLHAYLDLQYRFVNYEFLGIDNEGENLTQDAQLHFFNPKAGFLYQWNPSQQLYLSFAVANREPNRDDYTETPLANRPSPETLYNTELGYRLKSKTADFGANVYHMLYKDQLVLTGQINDVGAYTRRNVPDSYRLGLELDGQWLIADGWSVFGNATFSKNKIKTFTEFADSYDADFNWIGQEAIEREDTDIAFSPKVITSLGFNWEVFTSMKKKQQLELGLQGKYVSKQYIDNSSVDENTLNAYFFTDLRLGYNWEPTFAKKVSITLLVNNLFNSLYETNAWSYRYLYNGAELLDQGFYPQAETNFLLGVEVQF